MWEAVEWQRRVVAFRYIKKVFKVERISLVRQREDLSIAYIFLKLARRL